MMKKLRPLISYVCLTAFLFASPLGAWGTVVCQGDDGHSELELSVNNHCVEVGNSDHSDSSSLESCGCGPCEDYSLTTSIAKPRDHLVLSSFHHYDFAFFIPSSTSFLSHPLESLFSIKPLSYSYRKDSSLVMLQSIVLLI